MNNNEATLPSNVCKLKASSYGSAAIQPSHKFKQRNYEFEIKVLITATILVSLFLLLPSMLLAQYHVRFIVTGDSRSNSPVTAVNSEVLTEIVNATIIEDVDFIVFLGDLVWGRGTSTVSLEDQLTIWRDIMEPLYASGIKVYPCRGNHDAEYDTTDRAAWNNVFNGDYALPDNGPAGEKNITYSFSFQNVFVAALDQYVDGYYHINQSWLVEQFKQNRLPHIFIFGHAPAFKALHADCLDDLPSERNTFWESIAAEGGRTYFAGHDHLYDRSKIDDGDGNSKNDLYQYIVGTAGAPLYAALPRYDGENSHFTPQPVAYDFNYGYVLTEVLNSMATLTWKHRAGSGIYESGGDVFTYSINLDSDEDSISNNIDNCPYTPNGQDLGSCVKMLHNMPVGTGDFCSDDNACPDDAICQMEQSDFNNNAIGDVCECYADCDNDTNVSLSDLGIIKTEYERYNCNITHCDADLNEDNKVGMSDLAIMKFQFGLFKCQVLD